MTRRDLDRFFPRMMWLTVLITVFIVMLINIIRGREWYVYGIFLMVFVVHLIIFSHDLVQEEELERKDLERSQRESILKNGNFVELLLREGINPSDESIPVQQMIDILRERVVGLEGDISLVKKGKRDGEEGELD